jgi:hypothetical protein
MINYQFDTFTDYQYMMIDLANSFGLDKEEYSTRIQWVRDNMDILETLADKADEPYVYAKSLKNLRDVQLGKPTGALIRFDAICSGIQLLSVLTRCVKGCMATGAINDGKKRANAYRKVHRTMETILGEEFDVTYEDIKQAVMTSCYGSKAIPEELFGTGVKLEAFKQACMEVAPGAFGMLNPLKNTWDPTTKVHHWKLPDGYQAYVPVMATDIIDLVVDELGGYEMSTLIVENRAKEFGVSNIANVTHSIDGYVVRSLVRYCNYNPSTTKRIRKLVNDELATRKDESQTDQSILKTIEKLNLLDITIIDEITSFNVGKYPRQVLELMMKDVDLMESHPPFEVVPVHDCFGVRPSSMNRLRFWYNEILARLSNSTLLEMILSQLYHEEVNLKVFDEDIADRIRQNNYAIN